MDEMIKAELDSEIPTAFHAKMLTDSLALVKMSRTAMSEYYPHWDRNDAIYRGQRTADSADKKASERDEPSKMIVPASYAQVQTFVSFCLQLFTQRERLFELVGISAEDHDAARIAEAFVARDLKKSKFTVVLYQFLKDIGRFGVGILKTCWHQEMQNTVVQQPGVLANSPGGSQIQQTLKFLGNRISVVSPYSFFPDPRVPIGEFQRGEFVATEQYMTNAALRQLEAEGVISGVQFIPAMTNREISSRGGSTRLHGFNIENGKQLAPESLKDGAIVTEIQRSIIPSEYMIEDKPLGPETFPVKYVIWYANDQRVIRCEPMNYVHDEFTYSVGEYDPDQANLVNDGLQQVIAFLQEALTWFVNSRITNVRKVIGNKLIVDPSGIQMKDLAERNPVIRLQATAARQGVDKFIKQLDVVDVTANHVKDADVLFNWIQVATGINDNALGQFHTGRRSAQEARTVATAAAARLKMVALLIFETALETMARQMVSNLRDGLDEAQVVRLVGMEQAARGATFIKADKTALIGEYDFEVFDGTLPSERNLTAQFLGEVLTGLMAQPEAAIALQMDPKELMRETMLLRGVRNPERFRLAAPPQQAVPQPQQGMQPGAEVPQEPAPQMDQFANGLDGLIQG